MVAPPEAVPPESPAPGDEAGLALDAAEALALDGWLVGERGMSIPELMAAAGARVAEAARELLRARGLARVVVLEGPGNNGGDGVVAAALLAPEVEVREWRPLGRPDGARAVSDAALVWAAHRSACGVPRDAPIGPSSAPPLLDARTLVIDALFGVGLTRPPAGAARAALQAVRDSGAPVLAVDVPSGLDATTGRVTGGPDGLVVPALLTVSFVLPKKGLLEADGPALSGALRVVGIGFPASEAVAWLRRRRKRAGGPAGSRPSN